MYLAGGHLYKEKKEYILTWFKTKNGLIDFLISSAVWAYIMVNYAKLVFEYICSLTDFLGGGILQTYVSYLIFGFLSAIFGLGVSYLIYKVFDGK